MQTYFRLRDQLARRLLLTKLVTLTDLRPCLEGQLPVVRELPHPVDAQNGKWHQPKLTRGKAALHDAYVTSLMMMDL